MIKKPKPAVIGSLMILFLFVSCFYGIKGSGKVTKTDRQVNEFSAISASAGIEVILTQDSIVKIVVEADDNLQDNIKTEVVDEELKIYPEKRIRSCKAKRVYVSFQTIKSLDASSGSEIKSKTKMSLTSLDLTSSSGAKVNLMLILNRLNIEASSGADITVEGTVENLDVDGSSGANIKATALQSKSCNAGVSSGANIKIAVTEKITAKASSGGDIRVKGNPTERNIEKSSGGNVSFN